MLRRAEAWASLRIGWPKAPSTQFFSDLFPCQSGVRAIFHKDRNIAALDRRVLRVKWAPARWYRRIKHLPLIA